VHQAGEPSPFLLRHLAALPRGRALDLACGAGRHALVLARHGFRVDAVDRDPGALAVLAAAARMEGLAVRPLAADLERFPLPAAVWDLVLDVRYLQRSLAPAIAAALRPGGLLVFETFTIEQARLGRPRNPDFLLRPGELLRMFPGLEMLAFEEEVRDGREAVAALLARKP
jgi:SAM-dependent methyltransferase